MSVQGPAESTRDYLTRWAELRNSCEGVHEVQAIEYFTAGCREGTLLKHKLLCDEPTTLDELLVIADKYATADSSMKTELRVDASGKVLNPAPKTPAGDSGRRPHSNDHKRKGPTPPPASWQVATVEDAPPEGRPAGLAAGLLLRADSRRPVQVPQRRVAVQPHGPEVPLAHPNLQRRGARAASACRPAASGPAASGRSACSRSCARQIS